MDFDIDGVDDRCLGDYVEIRDGSSENASVIGKLCNQILTQQNIPMAIQSTQNYMSIRFLYTSTEKELN